MRCAQVFDEKAVGGTMKKIALLFPGNACEKGFVLEDYPINISVPQ